MNELFELIAQENGLLYGYGTSPEFEQLCSGVSTNYPGIVCFYECYDEVLFSTTVTGYVQPTYPFTIFLVKVSEIEEQVSLRLPKIDACIDMGIKVLNRLISDNTVVGARAVPVLSETTNQMAGVKLIGSFTGNPYSLC